MPLPFQDTSPRIVRAFVPYRAAPAVNRVLEAVVDNLVIVERVAAYPALCWSAGGAVPCRNVG
jgi:hypothetical protein